MLNLLFLCYTKSVFFACTLKYSRASLHMDPNIDCVKRHDNYAQQSNNSECATYLFYLRKWSLSVLSFSPITNSTFRVIAMIHTIIFLKRFCIFIVKLKVQFSQFHSSGTSYCIDVHKWKWELWFSIIFSQRCQLL